MRVWEFLDSCGDGHICLTAVELEERNWWVKVLKPFASLFVSWLSHNAAEQSWSVWSCALSIHDPYACETGFSDCHRACGSLELPRENKAAYREHKREFCNNLVLLSRAESGTTAWSQLPSLFQEVGIWATAGILCFVLFGGTWIHSVLLHMLTSQPTQPFPIFTRPQANLLHPSRFSSSISFPYKDFLDFAKWNEQESTW